MAIAKKGSRSLIVGDLRYRWKIVVSNSYYSGEQFQHAASLVVEVYERPAGRLYVPLESSGSLHISASRRSIALYRPDSSALRVTPAIVARIIAIAREHGWQPLECSSTFILEDKIQIKKCFSKI